MKKRKRELNFGGAVFNVVFILGYPIIIVFYAIFTALVWLFSLPSKLITLLLTKFKK
jgi:hypothetical protein